ncbi:MAG: hypothetical protein RMK01_10955 [Thermomicrobium sp.]|nr:hypothetical protein [Thermomicrobium sp.]
MTIDWTHPGTWLFVVAFVVLPVAVLAWAGWTVVARYRGTVGDGRQRSDQPADDPPNPKAS